MGLILAMVVTALLFDPVRKWIQERIDQFFYRTRYDYRKTLIEFGRELSAETDLDMMLSSVVDRLSRTLLVDRMAIFLSAGEPPAVRAGEVVRHDPDRRPGPELPERAPAGD